MTGGGKGQAMLWEYSGGWSPTPLELPEQHPIAGAPSTSTCCWTTDDRYAVAATERSTGLPGTEPEYAPAMFDVKMCTWSFSRVAFLRFDVLVWDTRHGGSKFVHALQRHTLEVNNYFALLCSSAAFIHS